MLIEKPPKIGDQNQHRIASLVLRACFVNSSTSLNSEMFPSMPHAHTRHTRGVRFAWAHILTHVEKHHHQTIRVCSTGVDDVYHVSQAQCQMECDQIGPEECHVFSYHRVNGTCLQYRLNREKSPVAPGIFMQAPCQSTNVATQHRTV